MHKNARTYIAGPLLVLGGTLILIYSLWKYVPRQADRTPEKDTAAVAAGNPAMESPASEELQDTAAPAAQTSELDAANNSRPPAEIPVETDAPTQPNACIQDTEVRPVSLGMASFSGSTTSGGAIIGGGWQEADGSRTFCFTSPRQLTGGSEGTLQVSFMVLNIPAGSSFDPAWSPLLESDANGIHRNALSQDAEQYTGLRRSLSSKPFGVMSSPLTTVADGGNGFISVTSRDKGILFSFAATTNPETGEIDLNVNAAGYEGMDPMNRSANTDGEE